MEVKVLEHDDETVESLLRPQAEEDREHSTAERSGGHVPDSTEVDDEMNMGSEDGEDTAEQTRRGKQRMVRMP